MGILENIHCHDDLLSITDGADPLGIAQQFDGLLGTGHLSCRHGMERLFIGGGHSHADDVKNNTHQNNDQQDQERHRHGAVFHQNIGKQRNGAGNKHGRKEYGDDPFDMFIPFFFR